MRPGSHEQNRSAGGELTSRGRPARAYSRLVAAGAPRVLVTCRYPERIRHELRHGFELDEHDSDEPLPRLELLARVGGVHGLAATPDDRIDEELLDAAGPGLVIVATFSVGTDHVDLEAATVRGVLVANTPGATTAPTAELTIAVMLGLLRRVVEGDRLVRAGRPWRFSPTFMLGRGLAGLTLGLVGFGQIGREVGRLAEAFGMGVVHHTRSGAGEPGWVPLDELLVTADVISLHCPLTDETRHLIDAAALARTKPTAVLVNAARGAVVDEPALVEALRAGTIAARGARRVRAGARGAFRAARARERRPRPTPRQRDRAGPGRDGRLLRCGTPWRAARAAPPRERPQPAGGPARARALSPGGPRRVV